jgi:hypothetical protein
MIRAHRRVAARTVQDRRRAADGAGPRLVVERGIDREVQIGAALGWGSVAHVGGEYHRE